VTGHRQLVTSISNFKPTTDQRRHLTGCQLPASSSGETSVVSFSRGHPPESPSVWPCRGLYFVFICPRPCPISPTARPRSPHAPGPQP
jgi:hypothetical protein